VVSRCRWPYGISPSAVSDAIAGSPNIAFKRCREQQCTAGMLWGVSCWTIVSLLRRDGNSSQRLVLFLLHAAECARMHLHEQLIQSQSTNSRVAMCMLIFLFTGYEPEIVKLNRLTHATIPVVSNHLFSLFYFGVMFYDLCNVQSISNHITTVCLSGHPKITDQFGRRYWPMFVCLFVSRIIQKDMGRLIMKFGDGQRKNWPKVRILVKRCSH